MIFLIDNNLERHAEVLLGNIANQGWLAIIPIRFISFKEVKLSVDSSESASATKSFVLFGELLKPIK